MSKILVDLDAVLANTPRMISKWSKEMFDIGPGDIPYKEALFNVEDAWEGMNFQKLKQIFEKPEFWQAIRPFSMASNFTKQLGKWGEVHVVTDRRWYPELTEETKHWLKENKISYNVLAVVKGKEKDEYCRDNNISVAIEDRPANIEPLSKVCPVIVMKWPYNEKELSGISNIEVADSYYQATKFVATALGRDLENWTVAQSTESLSEQ